LKVNTAVTQRVVKSIALGFVFVLSAAAQSQGAAPEFFPMELAQTYFAPYLRKMEEPSLYAMRNDTNLTVYRFLYLRSFHDPISIRVQPQGEHAIIKIARLKGPRLPEAKKLPDMTLSTNKAIITNLAKILEESGFWRAPSGEEPMGVDGAFWVLEALDRGRYHVMDRWSPDEDLERRKLQPFKETCLHFLRLGQLDLATERVY
jgi:hypothetical protein